MSFIAIALWALKPDKVDNDESMMSQYGVFFATLSDQCFYRLDDEI